MALKLTSSLLLKMTILILAVSIHRVHCAYKDMAPVAPPDGKKCTLKLSRCVGFVGNESKETEPGKKCCKVVESVMNGNAWCLCDFYQGMIKTGIPVNVTRAMDLPSACQVSDPPALNCDFSVPAPPPSGSTALAVSVSSVLMALLVVALFSVF